jgi:hypothetical protein
VQACIDHVPFGVEDMLSRFEVRDSYVQWFPVSSARTQTASCSYAVTHRRVIKTIMTLLFPAASACICNTPPRAGPSHHSTRLNMEQSSYAKACLPRRPVLVRTDETEAFNSSSGRVQPSASKAVRIRHSEDLFFRPMRPVIARLYRV